jgi:small subunit ribosomal protein S20
MAKEEKKVEKVRRPKAQKRAIQSEKRRLKNKAFKSSVRTAIRKFEDALDKKDQTIVKDSLNDVYSLMDKGVKQGIYKINKAGRTKARLTAHAAQLNATA